MLVSYELLRFTRAKYYTRHSFTKFEHAVDTMKLEGKRIAKEDWLACWKLVCVFSDLRDNQCIRNHPGCLVLKSPQASYSTEQGSGRRFDVGRSVFGLIVPMQSDHLKRRTVYKALYKALKAASCLVACANLIFTDGCGRHTRTEHASTCPIWRGPCAGLTWPQHGPFRMSGELLTQDT